MKKNNLNNHYDNFSIVFYKFGTFQECGTYICNNCGQKIYLEEYKKLPLCPKCGGKIFTKQ